MKEKIIYLASGVGLLVVGVFAVAAVVLTANDGFKTVANNEAFVSAFAGAFFTFILVKFAELGTRLRDIERKNLEALVAVNHTLNAHMNQLSNADFVARDLLDTYGKQRKDDEPIPINFNYFKPISFEPGVLQTIKNTVYINEVFGYYADLEKLNDSMMTLQKFADTITEGLISGKLSKTDYYNNVPVLQHLTIELRKFIKSALNKTERLSTLDRLLLEHRSVLLRLAVKVKTYNEYPKKVLDGYDAELAIVKEEAETNAAKSRQEIDSIVAED